MTFISPSNDTLRIKVLQRDTQLCYDFLTQHF